MKTCLLLVALATITEQDSSRSDEAALCLVTKSCRFLLYSGFRALLSEPLELERRPS